MEKSDKILTRPNRPGMFSDDKIQGSVDMDTNKTFYSELLDTNDHTITFRELKSSPHRENILLDSSIFIETQTAEIPIQYFNHMPVINELLALEYRGQVYLADVTDIDYKEGIIHVEQRLSHTTRLHHQRTLEFHTSLLREEGAYTVHQLAVLRQEQVEETQEYLNKLATEHKVFTVDNNGVCLYPKILFDDTGCLNENMANIVHHAIINMKLDGWQLWTALSHPSSTYEVHS